METEIKRLTESQTKLEEELLSIKTESGLKMNRYTIYCTEKQTRKALELGAPLEYHCPSEGEKVYHRPTAEQMICWLEEQEPIKEISIYRYERLTRRYWCYEIFGEKGCYLSTDEECSGEGYSSRKQATIAAIDAALDYLVNNKK